MWDTDKLLAEVARICDALVVEHREKQWIAPRCILFRTTGVHSGTVRLDPKAHRGVEKSKIEFASRIRQTIRRLRPEAALMISEMTMHRVDAPGRKETIYLNLERPGMPRTIWIAEIDQKGPRPALAEWTKHQPESWFGGRFMDFFVDLETPN